RERVVRLGLSLEPELLRRLDTWVRRRNSPSRSDAVRFLVRKEIAEEGLDDPEADAVGSVTLLYRHDDPNVLRRLTAAEHRWGEHVRSSTHVHLHGGACVESLILFGTRREIEAAAEDLRGVKGILQRRFETLTPAVAGGVTEHEHPHPHGRTSGRAASR
ncbi:MAG TPA: ribbon-helix-helix protein, CopG family, partial [Thermoplasmata archaeon]|nr:ribbon-helix-helix protein, CopG family [Thermoplasmata archaeon]